MIAAELPPPVTETVPSPARVRELVLSKPIVPLALLDVIVPELVSVLPFIFIVMFLFDATVTLALTVAVPAPETVVVIVTAPTAPLFRLRVTTLALTADFWNVRD